jgi:hypothetical protein
MNKRDEQDQRWAIAIVVLCVIGVAMVIASIF